MGTAGGISVLILHCRNILSLRNPPYMLQNQEIQNQRKLKRNARTFADLPSEGTQLSYLNPELVPWKSHLILMDEYQRRYQIR